MKCLRKLSGLAVFLTAVSTAASCSAEKPAATSEANTQSPSVVSQTATQKDTRNGSAMRVYIDPETGRPSVPPPGVTLPSSGEAPQYQGNQITPLGDITQPQPATAPGASGMWAPIKKPNKSLKTITQPDGSRKMEHVVETQEPAKEKQ